MIRREEEAGSLSGKPGWILISQVDHAHLAAELAEAWGNEEQPALPWPEILLPAIRDHDEGWREWERHPDIHPETHWPRNFTEMPATDAVRIWTQSIDICRRGRQSIVASVDEFRRFLTRKGMRLTHERAIVAEEVFSTREAFSADDLWDRLPPKDNGRRLSRAAVHRVLVLMEEARLLRKIAMGSYRDAYEQTRKLGDGSALGGIWVSMHFTFLAKLALEHYPEEPEIYAKFLEQQHQLQQYTAAEIGKDWGVKNPQNPIELGFQWVRFFDWLSLWFCYHLQTETETFAMPTGEKIHFTPLHSGEIAVEPFPFSVPDLEVEVEAKRILGKSFPDRAAFQAAYNRASRVRLKWKLVRW